MVSGNNARRVNNLSLAARADILVRRLGDKCNFYLSDITDICYRRRKHIAIAVIIPENRYSCSAIDYPNRLSSRVGGCRPQQWLCRSSGAKGRGSCLSGNVVSWLHHNCIL